MNSWLKASAVIGVIVVIASQIAKDLKSDNCTISSTGKLSNVACVKSKIEQVSEYSQFVNDLVLAQAILESNLVNKPSKLALNDNNLFGVKCKQAAINDRKRSDKECAKYQTVEYIKGKKLSINASFVHYESISESVKFRLEMFKMPRYQNVTNCSSFSDCAVRIQKSGYATDPRYAVELIRVYKEYIK